MPSSLFGLRKDDGDNQSESGMGDLDELIAAAASLSLGAEEEIRRLIAAEEQYQAEQCAQIGPVAVNPTLGTPPEVQAQPSMEQQESSWFGKKARRHARRAVRKAHRYDLPAARKKHRRALRADWKPAVPVHRAQPRAIDAAQKRTAKAQRTRRHVASTIAKARRH